jgi:hypothetical protein
MPRASRDFTGEYVAANAGSRRFFKDIDNREVRRVHDDDNAEPGHERLKIWRNSVEVLDSTSFFAPDGIGREPLHRGDDELPEAVAGNVQHRLLAPRERLSEDRADGIRWEVGAAVRAAGESGAGSPSEPATS